MLIPYLVERITPPIIKVVPTAIERVNVSLRKAIEEIIVTSGTRYI